MDCPHCKVELKIEDHMGIEVDRCPQCQGMWLDYHELDELEDNAFADDVAKASLMYRHYATDLSCPDCGGGLRMFNYRAWDLELDFCEQEHGFWLDAGEEKRVLELMNQREKDLNRSVKAEAEFGRFLSGLKSRGFVDKLKGLFKR
jgi:Zn-finger nucleic acid-binding protein